MNRRFRTLIFVLLFSMPFVCTAQKKDHSLRTVVIDPGHGGHDPGGVSKDKKTFEKDVVLSISKMLGEKIKAAYGSEVKVIYTRTTDVFIPLSQRAQIANKNNADLFISVHINSVTSTDPSGHSVYVLGKSKKGVDVVAKNLDVCKTENSVILLEDDYTTEYQGFDPSDEASYIFMTLMQSAFYEQSIEFASTVEKELTKGPIKKVYGSGVHQDAFLVLWKTSMPAVLLELGFISNKDDLAVLRSEKDKDLIAERIFAAFKTYKKNYDQTMKLADAQ